jgi:hypothetical protein
MSVTRRLSLAFSITAGAALLLIGDNPPAPTVDRVDFPTKVTKQR